MTEKFHFGGKYLQQITQIFIQWFLRYRRNYKGQLKGNFVLKVASVSPDFIRLTD